MNIWQRHFWERIGEIGEGWCLYQCQKCMKVKIEKPCDIEK